MKLRTARDLLTVINATKEIDDERGSLRYYDHFVGLPPENDDEIRQLKQIYITVIRDIERNGERSVFLTELYQSDCAQGKTCHAAMMASAFVRYPINARFEVEALCDIAYQIRTNEFIIRWGRSVVSSPSASCLGLTDDIIAFLLSVTSLPRKTRTKHLIRECIFGGRCEGCSSRTPGSLYEVQLGNDCKVASGFKLLRGDLARMALGRTDLSSECIYRTIVFQQGLLHIFFGKEASMLVMKKAKNRKAFELALERKGKRYSITSSRTHPSDDKWDGFRKVLQQKE